MTTDSRHCCFGGAGLNLHGGKAEQTSMCWRWGRMEEVGLAGRNVITYSTLYYTCSYTVDYLLSTEARSVKPSVEVSLYTSHCFYWQQFYCYRSSFYKALGDYWKPPARFECQPHPNSAWSSDSTYGLALLPPPPFTLSPMNTDCRPYSLLSLTATHHHPAST